jgi:hypothetical protein
VLVIRGNDGRCRELHQSDRFFTLFPTRVAKLFLVASHLTLPLTCPQRPPCLSGLEAGEISGLASPAPLKRYARGQKLMNAGTFRAEQARPH